MHKQLITMLLGADWEMAMDIIDSQGYSMNDYLAAASEQMSTVDKLAEAYYGGRRKEWRTWLLKRRQGTDNPTWYEQLQERRVHVQTGWAGMQLFNEALKKDVNDRYGS